MSHCTQILCSGTYENIMFVLQTFIDISSNVHVNYRHVCHNYLKNKVAPLPPNEGIVNVHIDEIKVVYENEYEKWVDIQKTTHRKNLIDCSVSL